MTTWRHANRYPWAILLTVALAACSSASTGEGDAGDTADESRTDGDVPPADVPDADDAAEVPPADVPPSDVPEDDASATDVPPTDVPAEVEEDVPPTDVPLEVHEDVPPIDGGCDPALETPSPGGMCDGRGRIACQTWAEVNGGPLAVAVCTSAGGGGCARATDCTDIGDPTTCRCGLLPACAPGEACVTAPDASPSCKCVVGP